MPSASPYGNVDLPTEDVFTHLFERKDRSFPDEQVIFEDGDDSSRKYTFMDIKQMSTDLGQGLMTQFGLKKGEVVAIFSANDIDFPPVVFGTLWAGGAISSANPGYTPSELAFQLEDSGSRIVVTQKNLLPKCLEACEKLNIPRSNILLMGTGRDAEFQHWTEVKPLKEAGIISKPHIDPEADMSFLVYSSGTTGRPKGVEITHKNSTSNVTQVVLGECQELSWKGSKHIDGITDAPDEGDTILTCLPFYHVYGLSHMMLAPTYTGVRNIVMAQFQIEKWCQIVQNQKVTFAYIVPPIMVLLSKHPVVAKYDLSSIRMTTSGAAPLTRELVDAVYERTGIRVKQGYGLSETSPTTFAQRWEDWHDGVGSVGQLLPNLEVKFCAVPGTEEYDEEEPQELPDGADGEIYVKGPNVFRGYHNNEAATRECLSHDGWFRTGDVGHLDETGNLFITDRVKELIKYKGFQVPPAELEGYLVMHDMVEDVAVVGIESKELVTEVPRAYIVRKGGMSAVKEGDDQVIMDWLAGRVCNHKKLRGGILWVESIPKSASGKILRRVLKDQVKVAQAAQVEVAQAAQVKVAQAAQVKVAQAPQVNVAQAAQVKVAQAAQEKVATAA